MWEMHVVLILTLPWYLFLLSIAVLDYTLDFVFWLFFGWYCSFCAGIFIWIVNLVHLPFTIWGWIQRAFLETFGAIIDGWMLFFGLSGCYIFIGHQCWYNDFGMYWALDIPWFTKDPEGANLMAKLSEKVTVPTIEKPEDFWTVRAEHRKEFLALIPVVREVIGFASIASDYLFAL